MRLIAQSNTLGSPFFCFNHQGKATAYIQALTERGWQETKDPGRACFILSDSDVRGRFRTLKEYAGRGIRIFIYPHAARPNIFWDFPDTPISPFIDAQFVIAQGHVDIMRAYGLRCILKVVGWHLCPIQPFKPRASVKRILFAPIHPNSNGFLSKIDRDLNVRAFKKLQTLITDDITLTVRYLRDLKQNGLWKASCVEYIQGDPDLSTREIDRADLVVSHQTFAHLAVARGIPTLMMGEWNPPRWGGTEETLAFVQHWDQYKDLLMYPLDILADEDIRDLVQRAIYSDADIADWRSRLIGRPFDPARFVQQLEECL